MKSIELLLIHKHGLYELKVKFLNHHHSIVQVELTMIVFPKRFNESLHCFLFDLKFYLNNHSFISYC